MNWPGPKNSGRNPRSFRFLVGGTLGPRQVGPLLDEILATCLWHTHYTVLLIMIRNLKIFIWFGARYAREHCCYTIMLPIG